MEFTINRVYITKRLEELQKLINSKASIPILTGLKIVLTENFLTLTAGNGDVFSEITISKDDDEANLEVKKTGDCVAVDSQLIIQFFKKSKSDIITFNLEENQQISIKAGRAKLKNGVTDSIIKYPVLATFEDSQSFTMKGFDLKKLISNTIFSVATTESRPILTGVQFSFKKEHLMLVSTDSHRLSKIIKTDIQSEEEFNFVVPGKTLKDLMPILIDEADITVKASSQHIAFIFGDVIYTGRLLEGKYPDTSRLIPQNPPIQIKANRKDLINTVNLISVAESANDIVMLNGNPLNDVLLLESVYTTNGKIDDEIEVKEYTGESIRIALKSKYFLDALKQFESDIVTLSIQGPMRPVLIESDLEPSIVELILPIRTH